MRIISFLLFFSVIEGCWWIKKETEKPKIRPAYQPPKTTIQEQLNPPVQERPRPLGVG